MLQLILWKSEQTAKSFSSPECQRNDWLSVDCITCECVPIHIYAQPELKLRPKVSLYQGAIAAGCVSFLLHVFDY